jgi:hypothetical protein
MIETKIDTPQGTTRKKEQFEEQLTVIDSKYQRWFGQRNHPFTGETDNIHNYFRYFTSAEGSVQLHLKDGLPLEIGKDCRLAFENIFQN